MPSLKFREENMKKRIAIIALSVFALGAIAAGCATKNGDKKRMEAIPSTRLRSCSRIKPR